MNLKTSNKKHLNEDNVSAYTQIIPLFAKYFDIEDTELAGNTRKARFVKIRSITVYILREYGKLSFPLIGNLLGNRDHTTISHLYNKCNDEINKEEFESNFLELIDIVKEIENKKQLITTSNLTSDKKLNIVKLTKIKKIPERDIKILELWREGETLESLSKIEKLTRQRVEQIVFITIKRMSINESITKGIKINYKDLLKEEKLKRKNKKEELKPKKIIKEKRSERWGPYPYEFCKKCETTDFLYAKHGLCERCGGSISGKMRETIISSHDNKCDFCGILREDAKKKYGRDFYISKEINVSCRGCHLKQTGVILGNSRKNKWKLFYK